MVGETALRGLARVTVKPPMVTLAGRTGTPLEGGPRLPRPGAPQVTLPSVEGSLVPTRKVLGPAVKDTPDVAAQGVIGIGATPRPLKIPNVFPCL